MTDVYDLANKIHDTIDTSQHGFVSNRLCLKCRLVDFW